MKTGIMVPVWRDYRWIAPVTFDAIRRHWPSHPEIYFCGLPAGSPLPKLPPDPGADRSNWTRCLLGGVEKMREMGFRLIYLILEEHLPLGPCQEEHLSRTLPALMDSLPASYISLMGWDNRRFSSKSAVLDDARHRLKHLVGPRDPRFHLHPALWRIDALEACCRVALADPKKNGSAWHFEKSCARSDNPELVPSTCYQICASRLAVRPPSSLSGMISSAERFIFHKLMALYPLIPSKAIASAYLRAVPFDDVFCGGPYPMFYSGIMAKGGLNKYFANFLSRHDSDLMKKILAAMPAR